MPDTEEPCVDSLITHFDTLFVESENTRLQRGSGEPVYLPADSDCRFHRIEFAHGYFRSALHEIAHWCQAGYERRQLLDYGYWYAPDGRDSTQQAAFEKVEVVPQAIEWLLSWACGIRFRVSVDNLNGESGCDQLFKDSVFQQLQLFCHSGLPARALLLYGELLQLFRPQLASQQGLLPRVENFILADLSL